MARQPKQPSNAPMPSWDCNSWARVPTGRYQGVAVRTQGPEWVRRYRRWSILVEFELLSGDGVVPCFYNLGSNPERPHAGRMSRYFQAWCLANSEPPRQWQQLDPATFMDGQVYTIEVTDGLKDHEGNLKPDGTVHSRVTAIIAVESPNQAIRQSGNQAIRVNQESKFTNSTTQVITHSSRQSLDPPATSAIKQSGNQAIRQSPPSSKASRLPREGNDQHNQPQRAGVSTPAQATPAPVEGEYQEFVL